MALPVDLRTERALSTDGPPDLDALEIDLLVEGIRQHYGYDFRNYAPSPLRRAIRQAMTAEGSRTISGLQEKVLHQRPAMDRFLGAVGVHVTSLFRDPAMFTALRTEVFPLLRTYPSVRIWLAGCATGEETYSLAILLQEAGMLRRCRLYATDMNGLALQRARRGTYPVEAIRAARERYRASGGTGELSDHLLEGSAGTFNDRLRRSITWAEHNLVTDASFNEFHLIVCANVLIYFGRGLQRQVYELLDASLVPGGFLALGGRETPGPGPARQYYRRMQPGVAIFHKVRE